MSEQVYHPKHYNTEGRKECWDEMLEIYGPEGVVFFDCMSAYKYDYRAGEKENNPEEQDRAKIGNYINHAQMIHDTYLEGDSRTQGVIDITKQKVGVEIDAG